MRARMLSLFWATGILACLTADRRCESAEVIRFTARAPQVGDESTQDARFQIELEMTVRETGRTIYSAARNIHRTQRRHVTKLKVDRGRVQQVRVRYQASSETSTAAGRPTQSTEHPVAGKTYLVSREAERLIVTYTDGSRPPAAEVEIVTRGMDAVGRSNPLVTFLNGRELTVGQTLQVPGKVARDLFGLGDAVGSAADFHLKLVGTHAVDDTACGVFEAQVDAESALASNLSMQISGRFWIEIDTCRTAAVELSGPVTMSEDQSSAAGRLHTSGRGTIQAAMRTHHGPTRR